MLRYNNQVGYSKPVDCFRPLTVDVSVEYELPKEVAPPPGSAPLLIIHPSAYYRSKFGAGSGPQGILSPNKPLKPTTSQTNESSSSTSSYYLRSSSTSNSNTANSNGLSNQHIYNSNGLIGGSSKSVRGYGNSSSQNNGSSISRSRSMTMGHGNNSPPSRGVVNCPYGKCDECASSNSSGCGRATTTSSTSTSRVTNTNGVKNQKPGLPRHQDSFNYYAQHTNTSTSTGNGTSMSKNQNPNHLHQLYSNSTSINALRSSSTSTMMDSNNTTRGSANTATSNKRLRMMSQQQNMQNMITPEPLNLAVASSQTTAAHLLHQQSINIQLNIQQQQQQNHPQSPSSIYLNQRSALYKQQQQQLLGHRNSLGLNNSSSSNALLSNNSGSGGGSSSNILQMINSYSINRGSYRSALNNPYMNTVNTNGSNMETSGGGFNMNISKEGAIPVDKGSGSDSGVCSENDSDVSPPMAPYHSNSNNLSRRSILSQELPSSGCYCCCCPTTSDSSSRGGKSNGGKVKSSSSGKSNSSRSTSASAYNTSSRERGNSIQMNSNSNSSGGSGVTSYSGVNVNSGSAYATMVIQESQLGNMLISCESPMASGFSPMAMDSSSSPATYRKWFLGSSGTAIPPIGDNSSLGRWFQV